MFLRTVYVTFAPDKMEKKLAPPSNQLNSRNLQLLSEKFCLYQSINDVEWTLGEPWGGTWG